MFKMSLAVYPRDNATKPYMLFDPKSRKVTYTPLDVERLQLNLISLPTYFQAIHLLANNTELVTVPFVKGRSQEDINSLISSVPTPIGSQYIEDIDIVNIPVYTGVYGNPAKVQALEKLVGHLVPCEQKNTKIYVNSIPEGSEDYEREVKYYELIELAVKYNLIGYEKVGKSVPYGNSFIISTSSFDDIINDINNCGRVYYLATTGTFEETGLRIKNNTTHALVLIVDSYNHIVELFDPNGYTTDYTDIVYQWL
jgi:hypothetical protein